MTMALERELAAFGRELPALLQDAEKRGKFALVRGDRIDSTWPSADEALAAGYDRFGPEPFLVREITDHQEPRYFSRNVTRCPS